MRTRKILKVLTILAVMAPATGAQVVKQICATPVNVQQAMDAVLAGGTGTVQLTPPLSLGGPAPGPLGTTSAMVITTEEALRAYAESASLSVEADIAAMFPDAGLGRRVSGDPGGSIAPRHIFDRTFANASPYDPCGSTPGGRFCFPAQCEPFVRDWWANIHASGEHWKKPFPWTPDDAMREFCAGSENPPGDTGLTPDAIITDDEWSRVQHLVARFYQSAVRRALRDNTSYASHALDNRARILAQRSIQRAINNGRESRLQTALRGMRGGAR
jgi:hypothetical protein